MMRAYLLCWIGLLISLSVISQNPQFSDEVILVYIPIENRQFYFVSDTQIYDQNWHDLPQIKFWREIMKTSKDTSLINIFSNRKILGKIPTEWYDNLPSRYEQTKLKDKIKRAFNIPNTTGLYITGGKKEYYQIVKVLPDIHEAICVFTEEEVDPWYAQAILLIESPGVLRFSPVGAYGPFQLMRQVALNQGLVVNSVTDERKDIHKASRAAATFIQNVCLPETRKLLKNRGISFEEDQLWFKLLVLHVYHSGASNVNNALKKLDSIQGGPSLIQQLWHVQNRGFQNASQNYSQIALASLLELEELIFQLKGFIRQNFYFD